MKTFIIYTAMAIFGALSHAAPLEAVRRQESVEVTFRGAPPDVAFFKQSFPTDGSFVYIYNPLSVSQIEHSGDATCTFFGINGSVTVVKGFEPEDVGPPQTQTGGFCVKS
jgi:hypothetical protein